MTENWCALCIAILNPKAATVEKAFEILNTGKVNIYSKISNADLEDMVKLKKEMTYKQLSQIYGRSDSGLCHVIKNYKKAMGV